MTGPLFSVDKLRVEFTGGPAPVVAVRDISLRVGAGEILAVVGESGSGKSALAMALAKLLPDNAEVSGSWTFHDRPPAPGGARGQHTPASRFGVIFQDPLSALNPAYTLGWQITERMRVAGVPRAERRRRGLELLAQVGMVEPERVYGLYPHEVSGGMRQRAMIAIALSGDPSLIIADEPTTALDVSVQKQVLVLLRDIVDRRNIGLILITHDLAVVADVADRVVVMYAGSMVENGPTQAVLRAPEHPYTRALLNCSLTLASPRKTLIPEIPGTVPQLGARLAHCPFVSRCPNARPLCREQVPAPVDAAMPHDASCHFKLEAGHA